MYLTTGSSVGSGRGKWHPLIALACATLCGCQLADVPAPEEIRAEALGDLTLPAAWTAADAEAGEIQDNWLASFGDGELELLTAEAIANNPDLRVAATRVEQAAGYVELARSALRPAVNLLGIGGLNTAGGDINSACTG